ncbi:MAG: tRNA adenosine(34) deaminase TadA [Puniceicoccales bacterium]|jgi:tRNA(adenine34) deaminase|nr:tRNA adenosine(34) deaminase TadA [Puniceicoccales bacterium]
MMIECPFPKKHPSLLHRDDEYFMSMAYNQAIEAWKHDETPVGAIAVLGDEIIASAYNSVITLNDPTAHAEMQVITQAAKIIGDWRLNDVAIYITKEPCPMCSGAMIMSRVGVIVFGTSDRKMGLLGGCFRLQDLKTLNHRPMIRSGILAEDCSLLMQAFFTMKRKESWQGSFK